VSFTQICAFKRHSYYAWVGCAWSRSILVRSCLLVLMSNCSIKQEQRIIVDSQLNPSTSYIFSHFMPVIFSYFFKFLWNLLIVLEYEVIIYSFCYLSWDWYQKFNGKSMLDIEYQNESRFSWITYIETCIWRSEWDKRLDWIKPHVLMNCQNFRLLKAAIFQCSYVTWVIHFCDRTIPGDD